METIKQVAHERYTTQTTNCTYTNNIAEQAFIDGAIWQKQNLQIYLIEYYEEKNGFQQTRIESIHTNIDDAKSAYESLVHDALKQPWVGTAPTFTRTNTQFCAANIQQQLTIEINIKTLNAMFTQQQLNEIFSENKTSLADDIKQYIDDYENTQQCDIDDLYKYLNDAVMLLKKSLKQITL